MTFEPTNGTSVAARLERIEWKLDHLGTRQDKAEEAIDELKDFRIEIGVYLRQLRWTLVVAGGALITGLVNLALVVSTHP